MKKANHLIIYPGRFHPPHPGHFQAWRWITGEFGAGRPDWFRDKFETPKAVIATSDHREDPDRQPFTFAEKKEIFKFRDIGTVQHARQPYRPKEITDGFDPKNTLLTFTVCEKDLTGEDSRFANIGTKKDGSPSYFQKWPGWKKGLRPMAEHAYIVVTPIFDFPVSNGEGQTRKFKSGSEVREAFRRFNEKGQRALIESLYGKYDEKLHKLMAERLGAQRGGDAPQAQGGQGGQQGGQGQQGQQGQGNQGQQAQG